jgi:hypothetical protein
MTDRINALTVVLDHDYREDDIEPLIQAIAQLRGVLRVKAHVADPSNAVAQSRADEKWRQRLYDLLALDTGR